VDEVDQSTKHQRVRLGQDAMTEVEDVARPASGLIEDGARPIPGGFPAGQ
jgi:hypothetical protein